jgi:hypothetical protein
MLAGCTFLISFDDVPVDDGGLDDAARSNPDVRVDARPDPDTGIVDGGADAADAIADPDACKGHVDGKYCGGNQLVWPGPNDDLITCKGGLVSSVKYCPTGQGCIRMLAGYPDQCDECASKPDGTYCGRDMPGWETKNANFRIRCEAPGQVGILPCGGSGCISNGDASHCP